MVQRSEITVTTVAEVSDDGEMAASYKVAYLEDGVEVVVSTEGGATGFVPCGKAKTNGSAHTLARHKASVCLTNFLEQRRS